MTRPSSRLSTLVAILIWIAVSAAMAQQGAAPAPSPYVVGNRLGLPILPDPAGTFNPNSSNVKVYGSIYRPKVVRTIPSVTSSWCRTVVCRRTCRPTTRGSRCSITTGRCIPRDGLAFRLRRPARASIRSSSSTSLRQRHRQRHALRGRPRWRHGPTDPGLGRAQVRHEDRRAGRRDARRAIDRLQRHRGADDGTVYATETGAGQNPDATTWQVWKITAERRGVDLRQGAPLRQPNGIALDRRATSWWSTSATPRC